MKKNTLKQVFGLEPSTRKLSRSSLRNVILKEIRAVILEDADPKKVDTDRFPLPLSTVAGAKDKAMALVGAGKDDVDGGKS